MNGLQVAGLFFVGALFWPAPAAAQTTPTISTNVLTERVAIGELGQIIYKGVGGTFEMPPRIEVPGLEVIHSGTQSGLNITNGVRTIEQTHFYRFRGDEPGTYTIPSVTIPFGNSQLQTNQIEITIFERDGSEAIDATRPYFAKLELPKTEFYVNELVPLTMTAYVRGRNSINEINHVSLEHESFVIRNSRRVNTDGAELGNSYYSSATIPAALFALKPGAHRLGPGQIGIRVLDQGSSFGFSSFFNRTVLREIATNTVNVTIKPLPAGAPASFTGGVGEFQMTAAPSLTELKVGDPLTMEFTVTGKGNLGTMSAPVFRVAPTGLWRSYDPAKKLDPEKDSDGFSEGSVTFTQVLIPEAKVDTIPAFDLTYFDPGKGSYETVSTEAIPVSISADTATEPAPSVASTVAGDDSYGVAPAAAPVPLFEDMMHIRTGPAHWLASAEPRGPGALFWVMQAFFSVAFCTVLGYGLVRWWKSRQLAAAARTDFTAMLSSVPGPGAPRTEFFKRVSLALEAWKREHPSAPAPVLEVVERVRSRCDAILYGGRAQKDVPVSRDEASEFRAILERLPRR